MRTEIQQMQGPGKLDLRLDGLCHLPNSSSGVLEASTNIIAELVENQVR